MLTITNLTKKIKNKIIFKDKNLKVEKNTLTFIVSPSGSGKTTLLNLIGGLDTKYEGTIEYIDNQNRIVDLKRKDSINLIDFIFQDFNLLNNLSVKENLKIAQNVLGKNFSTEKQEEFFSFLRLDKDTLNKNVRKLSGGEKQRIAILRAITRESEILLVDEPTGNLDKENSEIIFNLLKQISKYRTVIVVSHDIDSAKKYADNIYDLEKNQTVQNNSWINDNHSFEYPNLAIDSKKNFLNKLKPIASLVKADFLRKKIQFIFVIFMLIFSTLSIGTFLGMNTAAQNATVQNVVYTNADLLQVGKKIKFNTQPIFDDEVDKIKKIEYLKHTLPIYHNDEIFYKTYFGYEDINKKYQDINLSIIDSSPFYQNRLKSLAIQGNTIKNFDEIILGKDLLEEMNIINPLDNKFINFYLNSNDPNEEVIKLKIVGINNEKNVNDKYDTIIHTDFLKNILIQEKDKINLGTQHLKISDYNAPVNTIKESYNFIGLSTANTNEKIVKGRNVQNPNELLLLSNDRNKNIDLNKEWIINILGLSWKFKVVGLYEGAENIGNAKILKSDLDKISKIYPTELKIFFNEDTDKNIIRNSLFKINDNFDLNFNSGNLINKFLDNSKTLVAALSYGTIVLSTISFVFILIFSKIISDSKRKEVGILKLLGSSTIQVVTYHIFTFISIMVFTLVISLILYYPSFLVFEALMLGQNSIFVEINHLEILKIFIYVWLFFFAASLILYSMMSIKTFKSKTINLLR